MLFFDILESPAKLAKYLLRYVGTLYYFDWALRLGTAVPAGFPPYPLTLISNDCNLGMIVRICCMSGCHPVLAPVMRGRHSW